MCKLFIACVFLLSISFVPAMNNQFAAQAGRTVGGFGQGEYCDCGVPDPPCYIENTWTLCNGDPQGGGQIQAVPPVESSKVSIGLLIFTALFLLKRFI